MIDKNGRCIDYLRISLTDRCNLRCIYCMPEEGVHAMRHEQILSFEEIERLVRIMTGLGLKHLRLTGGEPMVRRGCLELAGRLHGIPEVGSISMTSNGILLEGKVCEAKRSGISSLNISLDSLHPDTYSRLTRGGDVSRVLRTIHEALDEGIQVKINTVPVRGYNDEDLTEIAALAKNAPLCVRFIELMPIGCGGSAQRILCPEVMKKLEDAFGKPEPDPSVRGHGPARYVKYPSFQGSVGYISAVSHEFCDNCNRIRLTADGQLKLCLNHTKGIDLRGMLRTGASDEEILSAVRAAVADKPARHAFYEKISDHEDRYMNAIGG